MSNDNSAEDFRNAVNAAYTRLSEMKAERERAENPPPPPPPFSAEGSRDGEDLSARRYTADGSPLQILEEDGDVVLAVLLGEEVVLDAADVLPLCRLSYAAAFRALRISEGSRDRRHTPDYALRGKSGRSVVVFAGRLCVPFRKRRGRVTYYAPVKEEEAERILNGTASVYYSGNRIEIK